MAKKPSAAAKSKKKAPELFELGDSGTRILDGIVREEYNAKLQDVRGIAVYDEMRRSDGTVRSLCLAVTLPVRAANWFVKPATEEARDQEIAEFVKAALSRRLISPSTIIFGKRCSICPTASWR